MTTISPGESQLKTLMRLSFIFDSAGENVLGKGALAMMYQAGRDAGSSQREPFGRCADVEEALRMVLMEGDDIWLFEAWQEPGAEDVWTEANGRSRAFFVFRRCPLLSLARNAGSVPGGILCHTLHGYIAGSLENIVGRRVDVRVAHCGPRACKLLLELKD